MILATFLSATSQETVSSVVDFPFVTRDGKSTTLYAEIEKMPATPESSTRLLLLFDPDCEECQELIEQLKSAPDAKVIAVYPVDGPLSPDDPNLPPYLRACAELPPEWVVGIDNGSILADDLYYWEHLPMLVTIPF